jgi:hypothetical protein
MTIQRQLRKVRGQKLLHSPSVILLQDGFYLQDADRRHDTRARRIAVEVTRSFYARHSC